MNSDMFLQIENNSNPNINQEQSEKNQTAAGFGSSVNMGCTEAPKIARRRNKFIKPNLNLVRSYPPASNNENSVLFTTSTQVSNLSTSIESVEKNVSLELEYPVPPSSPSKINRSRIKAVPRLGQRHGSFSASESEDESRRNYQRKRNDSISSSTASGVQDNASIIECSSPQKPKEFNILIQRKCRRTDQSRKLAEARREFYSKFGNNKPDRQKLTMIDLIFYNPTTNLMSHGPKQKKESVNEVPKNEEEKVVEVLEKIENEIEKSEEENELPAPQIKIGPQGEIVLDEQSLIIESKSVKRGREEMQKQNIIDGNFDTSYGMYKRAKRSKDWSKKETITFYKALNTIGTDFTLMCDLFPRRTRRELKMKFKKEERVNKQLVDRAIMQPCGFDFNEFKAEVELEESEILAVEKQKLKEVEIKKQVKNKETESKLNTNKQKKSVVRLSSCKNSKHSASNEQKLKSPKAKKSKKAQLDIMRVLDDENSDADDEFDDASNDYNDELHILENMQKPTRSGRVPKLVYPQKHCIDEDEIQQEIYDAVPGSLKVSTGKGPNGASVYNVCMMVGDKEFPVGSDISSLKKAMEFKENYQVEKEKIKSLFCISSTPVVVSSNNEIILNNANV